MNRLGTATSPYLLQHKDNPVDWWEWGPDAFEDARRRDVPVLLSVGYAACHWCHVMAHESFDDAETAAYMNTHFVNIKVDREERPDVDAVYMEATTAMTGHGGWPMTCILTADGAPFFCGTYFPDRPRQGSPSFRQVLEALVTAWRDRRDQIDKVGADVVAHLNTERRQSGTAGPPDEKDLERSVALLERDFDKRSAGFGGAPKFPPSMLLEFLLRHSARTGSASALSMAGQTFEAMARGGIYDQLGGGFARYSVDAGWVVPHFEKMLYDNALLLRAYLHWWRQTGNALGARVAQEIAEFCLRELRTPEGGFASALDADSPVNGHGGTGRKEEGAYYVWTPAQLADVLGDEDGAWAAQFFAVTSQGTFEHGTSTLQRLGEPADDGERARLDAVRVSLLESRKGRPRPQRDDKVVAAWNGLLVPGLTEAAVLLGQPRFAMAAVEAAELLWALHVRDGRLLRVSRDGVAGAHAGVLDDYGCMAEAFLAVLGLTGDAVWLTRAETLLEQVLTRFADGRGGFFDTAADAETLVRRPQDPTDNASPSGQSAAVTALLSYAAITGSGRHREAAEAALAPTRALARQGPRFAGWGLAAAEAVLAGPLEVAVVGALEDPARAALHFIAVSATAPGTVVVAGEPDNGDVPLLRDRLLMDGEAAAYVCRGFVCERPVTDPADLRRLLAAA